MLSTRNETKKTAYCTKNKIEIVTITQICSTQNEIQKLESSINTGS
ncbi:MAG: hypothetical protein ACI959_002131 [Limisphaerales bacterium]|jgi:hypothetical protein